MKTNTSILSLLVAAGLLSSSVSANAEIVHVDLSLINVTNWSGGTRTERTLSYYFQFNDGVFSGSGYNENFNIYSNYIDDTNYYNEGYHYTSTQSSFRAHGGAATLLGLVNSGDVINSSLSPASYFAGTVSGYSYTLNQAGEDINSYGLDVGSSILALSSFGYYGYALLSIPETSGRMYISDIVFNSVRFEGIVAGQAVAAPDAPPPVPEPSTYGLMGIGALGIAFAARRRKSKNA